MKRYILRGQNGAKCARTKDMLSVLGMALYAAVVFCVFLAYGLHSQAAEVPEPTPPAVSTESPESGRGDHAPTLMTEVQWDDAEPAAYVDPDMGETDPGTETHVIENCVVTYYCAERYPHICGTGNGITATGAEAVPGVTCAVDPSVIPYGSIVSVDYGDGVLYEYIAQDSGAWVNENHIDICVDKHDTALELGRRTATVWWALPENAV